MYNLIDRPVTSLPEGSRFLLWAMRAWVTVSRKGDCPPARLASAFLRMSAIEALPHLHIAMSALNYDGRALLEFHCLHRDQIGDDEAVLLHLWSDMAAGNESVAVAVIELLVKEEAVMPLFSAIKATIPGFQAADLNPQVPALPHSITGDRG
ncbi:hypothetical protein [Rhizorhapis suberifaciens]|uniref:Uncharacterized protein n=1 Tax=Rhizorhapis suberifaciens TaxID=13656 RepID=A0A840HSL8_9SPHN|nr:hypothetical protein [Rhizorhapis suberifaciens]MBB4640506.1 hypothetical protein [Rhizorhapis suberifaciens]